MASKQELIDTLGGATVPADVVIDARGRPPMGLAEVQAGTQIVGGGSRGKSLGVLQLHFGGASSWVFADVDTLETRIDRTETLLGNARNRAEAATTEAASNRYIQQIQLYEQQLEGLNRQRLLAQSATGNRIMVTQVDLDRTVADHAPTQAKVDAAKQRITAAASANPRAFVPRVVAQGPFAGGETCVACHREQHLQWSTTAHARAWKALLDEDRAFDSACWSCHVTGADTDGGPRSPREAAGFHDVQCEACHGPARAHVASPGEVKPVRNPPLEVCTACHDGEQDGGRFDASTYRPKILHTPAAP